MSLFDKCKLPDDDRALEILQRISDVWEDNASTRSICNGIIPNPAIYHQRVSTELKEKLIKLSETSPRDLEDMLNAECSLHNILRFAEEAVD